MNAIRALGIVLVMMLLVGAAAQVSETEKEIPLSKVPEEVLTAAQEAVPDIKLTEADVEKTEDGLVYELEGVANGKEYEIELTAEGKVLEVEQEKDKKEDEDEDKQDEDSPPIQSSTPRL